MKVRVTILPRFERCSYRQITIVSCLAAGVHLVFPYTGQRGKIHSELTGKRRRADMT